MTKFGFIFLLLLGGSAIWSLAQGAGIAPVRDDSAVSRNEGLTAGAGGVIYLLPVAMAVTVFDIHKLLLVHYVVGFVMIPPVMLKLAATGYRFVRYYLGSQTYRFTGAPPALLRFIVAPVLVSATVLVFATGIELWLFGLRFGSFWIPAHTFSAVVMVLAGAAHLVAHLRRSVDIIREDLATRRRTVFSRQSLVLGSLAFGVVLGIGSVLYASPFSASFAGG